jgi:hypothetical protein
MDGNISRASEIVDMTEEQMAELGDKVLRILALKKAVIDYHSLSYMTDVETLDSKLDNEESIISAATELIRKITEEDPRYDRVFRETTEE